MCYISLHNLAIRRNFVRRCHSHGVVPWLNAQKMFVYYGWVCVCAHTRVRLCNYVGVGGMCVVLCILNATIGAACMHIICAFAV